MKISSCVAAVVSLSVIAGCSGGSLGSSFAPVGSGPITNAEIDRITSEIETLFDAFDATDVTLAVPSTANASYNGFIGVELDFVTSVTGRMSVDADFAGGSLTGSAGDFSVFDESGSSPVIVENLSGTLPITGGVISGTAMTADINGTLAASTGSYGVAGNLSGQFADISGQNIVAGIVSGSLTNPDTSVVPLDGGFLAAQE